MNAQAQLGCDVSYRNSGNARYVTDSMVSSLGDCVPFETDVFARAVKYAEETVSVYEKRLVSYLSKRCSFLELLARLVWCCTVVHLLQQFYILIGTNYA